MHTLHRATQEIRDLTNNIRHEAHQQLSLAQREVPTLFSEVRHEAHAAVKAARTQIASKIEAVRDRAVLDSRRSHEAMEAHRHGIAQGARRSLTDASAQTTALFRGFALVRNVERTLITSLVQTHPGQSLEIQFRDGLVTSLVTTK